MLSVTVAQSRVQARAVVRCAGSRRSSVVVRAQQINPAIQKDAEKVVDIKKTSELPKKAVFCRCWRSKAFPMCDGAHVAHNKETGDNVGPLIVEKDS